MPPKVNILDILGHVKSIVAIASGKGGVGKSTVSANLALALAASGAKVGLMDADVYGPSIPTILGITDQPVDPEVSNLDHDGVRPGLQGAGRLHAKRRLLHDA